MPIEPTPSGDAAKPSEKKMPEPDSSLTTAIGNRQYLSIPRWIVYFQAALLGIVATTFFIFGLMVGSITSDGQPRIAKTDVSIKGQVFYQTNGDAKPDEGAVIFLLPTSRRPAERAPANLVSPSGFQPLDNPGIEKVHQLGGAIVRADENGRFEVVVDGNNGPGVDYFVLAVSCNQPNVDDSPLTKQQTAAVGTFFMPVERLVEDRAIYWSTISAGTERIEMMDIHF
jgi:hypothetical protein